MTTDQRKMLADKLYDLANITAGTLIIGRAVSGDVFSILSFIFGILITAVLYLTSYLLSK